MREEPQGEQTDVLATMRAMEADTDIVTDGGKGNGMQSIFTWFPTKTQQKQVPDGLEDQCSSIDAMALSMSKTRIPWESEFRTDGSGMVSN